VKKRIIWSNTDLNIDDWRDGYKEYLEINERDDEDPNDEDAIYEWMVETNNMYFEDEQHNLNKELEGRIIIIADLGLWNGRKQGYKLLGTNINTIFNINSRGFDYAEFYGDGHNIRGTEHHHDGTNYYLYRVIRENRNIDKLLDAIYNGEEITSSKLNYYTRSLYKDVADVYGWR
jgi:hypothetical protein